MRLKKANIFTSLIFHFFPKYFTLITFWSDIGRTEIDELSYKNFFIIYI